MADGEGVAAPGNQRRPGSVIAERWKRVETVFEQALEIPPTARAKFLEETCDGDEQLRVEIESLLNAHGQAGDFLENQDLYFSDESFPANGDTFVPGEKIDRYRIIREMGRGGMGAVYLAERADDQYQKQVALKLIKRGMDTETVLRRFRNERQILAGFDHPNIARLLDGGTTETGLPFFVMEYIEGLPIDEYCKVHALSVVQRLQLFQKVCAAVSYAHRHLVIHRDIKRSNILVTPEGQPKLLDFGIAKILQEGDEADPVATMIGMRPMTPGYASPEQLRGERMTTASDVYSLGVVLYELLCGSLPYESSSESPHEMARVIADVELKKPSKVVRSADDAKLLKGDLDNIALMALRSEPDRRYQSVEQFAEDLRRHLEERPVHARKDTAAYRAAKFIRRNRITVAAAALVLVALVAGIITTLWQAQRARVQEAAAKAEKARAERRFNEVRKLAHSVLFDYHDAIRSLPGATKVREQLVKDALAYLDSLVAEAHGDAALQRELAAGYERVGDVRGGQRTASLGDTAGAAESYSKALQIREALVARQPDDMRARRELAGAHADLGTCFMKVNPTEAIEHLKQANSLYLDLTRQQPGDDTILDDLAVVSTAYGNALRTVGNLSAALEQYRGAASIAEKLVQRQPHEPRYRLSQAGTEQTLARALWDQYVDKAAAKQANDKALVIAQALAEEDPVKTDYQHLLFHVCLLAGHMREESEPSAALPYLRRAVEIEEKQVQADPADSGAEIRLADAAMNIAHTLSRVGEVAEALSRYRESAEQYEKVSGSTSPPNPGPALKALTARAGAAGMLALSGDGDPARDECHRLTARLREIPDDTANITFRLFRAEAYEYLGYAERNIAAKASITASKQHFAAARDMFRASLDIFNDVRARGGLDAADGKEADGVAAELAKCDTELGK